MMQSKHNRIFWATFSNLSQTVKRTVFSVVFLTYWAVYPVIVKNYGAPYRTIAISYIILSAMFWGLKGGLVCTVCGIAAGWSLQLVLGIEYTAGFLGPLFGLSIAGILGYLRDLNLRLDAELKEGAAAKNELEAYKNSLEKIVEKRTEDLSRLATAIDQAAETIIVTDIEGNIIYANPSFERTTGYTVKEALGRNPKILKSGKQDETFYKNLWDTVSGGDVWTGQLINKKKHGELFREDATISPVKNASGQIINFVAVKRDITHEFDLEKSLRQAQKMEAIGVLAGGIAHDFNNILAAIIGYTELLMMNLNENTQEFTNANQIHKAGSRAKELVQQILTFSRQTKQELEPVEIGGIVREITTLLRSSLPSTIEIRQTIRDRSLVMGNPTQIYQILMNLCSNASHAMRGIGGLIDIELKNIELHEEPFSEQIQLMAGNYVRLSVSDTGRGIQPEHLDRVFDPFFTTKDKSEGTGMGLSVVHGIVKSYKGAIDVYSEEGRGTTFKIFLPAVEKKGELPEMTEIKDMPRGTERILFVDDERVLTEIGSAQLQTLGYKVTTRSNGTGALALIKKEPDKFDLVITDLTMPQMTGDELAAQIKDIRPGIPIILCTGYSSKIDPDRPRLTGVDAVLLKPVVMQELANTVRNALDKSQPGQQ